tara:strand:+ start:1508 stop:1756 length:249 start_codon:yes stop_codon:yes gene_type:complete
VRHTKQKAQQALGLLLCVLCRMADLKLSFDKSRRDLGGAKRRGKAPRIAKAIRSQSCPEAPLISSIRETHRAALKWLKLKSE